MSEKGILKASIIQMAFNAVAIGLVFLREMLLANFFGASEATDAYLVAYALPFVLYTVMTTVLPLVLVPALEREGPRSPGGRRLLSGSLTWQVIILGGLCAIGWLVAPYLVKLQAPGLSPQATLQAVSLFRTMLPIVLILPLAWTLCSLLLALKTFVLQALGKVLFALVGLLALALFARTGGVSVAAWGVLIAALVQLAVMAPTFVRNKLSLLDWGAARGSSTRRLFGSTLVMIPVQANLYLYLIVDRFLASHLPAGTISILNYGDKVVKAFTGITTAALGVVIFSYLAEAAASRDHARLDSTAAFALRLMAIILLPLQVGAMVLGAPLIRLLFQHGAFGAGDAALTTTAMNLQLAGLFATGFSLVLYRVLFALEEYKTALLASGLMVILNVALKAMLVGPLGFKAMPLATSIAAVAEVALLGCLLVGRLPSLRARALWGEMGKILASAAAMGALVGWGRTAIERLSPSTPPALVLVGVCGLGGAALYLALLQVFHVQGVGSFVEAVRSALGKRRPEPQGPTQ